MLSTERKVYTVEEMAKVLGLGRSAAYEAIQEGRVPHLRIGRRIVVPVAALEKMLAEAQCSGQVGA